MNTDGVASLVATAAESIVQPTRFVARQPILDARRNVFGYELLFRSGWRNFFSGEADDATLQTLDNCLVMGIEALADHSIAFVNCTREALVNRLVTLLPPATTVLEILETVEPDPELLDACYALRDMGYRFALDDFIPRPSMQPLIEIASFIKVDFQQSDAAMRQQIRDMVRGSGAALLAEKVMSQQEYDIALAEGHEYFQGYFFCRPKIITDREIPPNWVNYLRLLSELTRTPLNLLEVTQIVEAEISICYRLLRLANSALMGMRNNVTSVHSALMLVGEDRFRTLVTLAVSGALGRDRPSALITLSLERARFCELLGRLIGESPTEQYMLGLLSLLDAILQCPMETLVKALPLRAEAKAVLLGAKNRIALPLNLVRSFELGDWAPCAAAARELHITEAKLAGIYLESLKWAAEAFASSR
jgi:EAL and modified HD-GYP domain-containing signal transduction protein